MKYLVFILSCLLCLASSACLEETLSGGSSGDASTLDPGELDTLLDQADSANQGEAAAVNIQQKARVGSLPSNLIGDRNLNLSLVGTESDIMLDVDGDEQAESVYLFVVDPAVEQLTFLAWEKDAVCYLVWSDDGKGFQVQALCGGLEGNIICSHTQGFTDQVCHQCLDGECVACEAEANIVDCPDDEDEEPANNNPRECEPFCDDFQCTADSDCPDGQRCFRQGANQFCVTPCFDDFDCGSGTFCQNGACLEQNNQEEGDPPSQETCETLVRDLCDRACRCTDMFFDQGLCAYGTIGFQDEELCVVSSLERCHQFLSASSAQRCLAELPSAQCPDGSLRLPPSCEAFDF